MSLRESRNQILMLLAIAAVARAISLFLSEAPIIGWRPSDMASIALNYFRGGMQFLHPQINWGGDGPGFVEMEFPILPFAVAVMYKVFGVHEELALIIPILSGLGLVVITYLFTKDLVNSTAGFLAGSIVAISPALTFTSSRLFPDVPMLFAGTLGLYLLFLWVRTGRSGLLVAGALAVSTALLLKLTGLFFGLPVAYIAYLRWGRRFWRTPQAWGLALAILLGPALWYWYAHTLYVEWHNTFGILDKGYSKFSSIQLLLNPTFYLREIFHFAMYHVTIVGFAAMCAGLIVMTKSRDQVLLYVWLLATIIYVVAAGQGVLIGHRQYLIPPLVPAAMFAGIGLEWFIRASAKGYDRLQALRAAPYFAPAVYALVLLGACGGAALMGKKDRFDELIASEQRVTGMLVGTITRPGSLLIVTDTQMDEFAPDRSMTPPDVFYFSDRKGWYLSNSWLTTSTIDSLRGRGGKYFVVSGHSADHFRKERHDIQSYLASRYQTLVDDERGIIYNLVPDVTRSEQGEALIP